MPFEGKPWHRLARGEIIIETFKAGPEGWRVPGLGMAMENHPLADDLP